MNKFWLTATTLWRREMVRFYRQPSRIIGALGSPVVFWLVIGSGIGTSFKAGSAAGPLNYSQYFFPGTLLLILFFTAIFSTISLIEDRREGFLQSVLVAPVAPASIAIGKILGGTSLALVQGILFLLLAPWIGIPLGAAAWLQTLVMLLINSFVLTSLGFVVAWQFDSIQGFHAVMNLFLIPLWLLSGALFPAEGATGWIRTVMKINPLTYGLTCIRLSLFPRVHDGHEPSLLFSMMLILVFGAALVTVAGILTGQRKVRV